ncbi:MAG: hypothetical protein ACLFST_00610 [Spirochaetia bacterium]
MVKTGPVSVILLLILLLPLHGEEERFFALEFIDQKVSDILLTLAGGADLSVTWDQTVTGRTSFRFSRMNYTEALYAFLETIDLYRTEKNGVLHVSRIKITLREDGLIDADSRGADPGLFITRLSRELKQTIPCDSLPSLGLDIHEEGCTLRELLTAVAASVSGFTVKDESGILALRRQREERSFVRESPDTIKYGVTGSEYRLTVADSPLMEVLGTIFESEDIPYVSSLDGRMTLKNFRHKADSFRELVDYLALWCGGVVREHEGILYLVPDKASAETIRFHDLFSINLSPPHLHSAAESIPRSLFDGEFIFDREEGKLIYIGLPEEFVLLEGLIEALKRPGCAEIPEVRPVFLQYISPRDLLADPPPSFRRDSVFPGPGGNLLFHVGTEQEYRQVLRETTLADVREPVITYQLLIIRYSRSADRGHDIQLRNNPVSLGNRNVLFTSLGELLSLNFNVITAFGYAFALNLSADLAENKAAVLADISLRGKSGESVTFTNTDTFRYRELEGTAEPSRGTAGVVRELTSGLILELTGRRRTPEEIEVSLSAALSKRGVDLSARSGNPPPTSERLLRTVVTVSPGSPVLAGSLFQQEITHSKKSAPLFGWLFGRSTKTMEETEVAFYLSVYTDDRESRTGRGDRIEKILSLLPEER